MHTTTTRPLAVSPTAQASPEELLWFFGNLVHVKLRRSDTGGAFVLTEHWADHGDTPPLHRHRNDDETFYVLEGELELHVAGAPPVRVAAGGTILAPREVPHTYRVVSPEGARWLLLTAPGDFEGFVDEASRPAEGATVPPAPNGPPPAEQVRQMVELAQRHGIEILGPPGTLPTDA